MSVDNRNKIRYNMIRKSRKNCHRVVECKSIRGHIVRSLKMCCECFFEIKRQKGCIYFYYENIEEIDRLFFVCGDTALDVIRIIHKHLIFYF